MTRLTSGLALVVVLLSGPAHAWGDSAWALIEPARADPEASLWDRLSYWWTHGNGWVVNHFFASAEACREVERRWAAEANKIMVSKTRELREIVRANDLVTSRCVPAEALSVFDVRPGSAFPQR